VFTRTVKFEVSVSSSVASMLRIEVAESVG
jgi:hypothetical protein